MALSAAARTCTKIKDLAYDLRLPNSSALFSTNCLGLETCLGDFLFTSKRIWLV